MTDQAFTFDDVLLIPAYNHHASRKDVDISMVDKTGKLKMSLPVFSANMDTITESSMAQWMEGKGGLGVLHRFMTIERNVAEFLKSPKATFVSVGCSEEEKRRVSALAESGATNFCVDVAHGHAKYVGKTIKWMRKALPKESVIMAGNVCTYAGADYLASVGADIVKVGVGPGSACTTRIQTGFGVPQLTAVRECSRVGISIVADGGIRYSGDVVKALAFGADFVMLGGYLSGTHHTPGNPTFPEDSPGFKTFRGMASKEVADEYAGGLSEWKTAEGVATTVPYRDEEKSNFLISQIIGGLRSGLTYGGSKDIRELQRKLDYVLISASGRAESHPHVLK